MAGDGLLSIGEPASEGVWLHAHDNPTFKCTVLVYRETNTSKYKTQTV